MYYAYIRAHTHEYTYLSIRSNAIILSSTTHFHILHSCPAQVIYFYVVCTHINNTLQRLRVFTTYTIVYSGSCATFVAATRLTDRPTGPLVQYVYINITNDITTYTQRVDHHHRFTPTTGFLAIIPVENLWKSRCFPILYST